MLTVQTDHTDRCDGHGHNHAHGPGGHVHGATSGPMLWVSLFITVAFVIGEAIAGYLAHSLALMSDAGHNLSDALALGLAAYAVWIAKKPPNAKRTFGYHRVGILTALFNAVTLVAIGLLVLVQAFSLWRHPQQVNGTLMLWVAAIAVLMNTVIAVLLQGGAKESINIRAAFVHMAGDALSSLAVVIAGLIVMKTGWPYADPVVSVLIAVFILYTSVGIVRDAADVLLEGTPRNLEVEKVAEALRRVAGVESVHDLHAWTVADGMHYLSCHIVVHDGCTMPACSRIIQEANEVLSHTFQIAHATIQIELHGDCVTTAHQNPLFCGESAPSQA